MNSQQPIRDSMRVVSISLLLTACASIAVAKDIHVPEDKPTIQKGIDVAVTGDRVLVAPGTYYEHIDFFGKTIELIGTEGAGRTIIDGSNTGTVMTFDRAEAGVVRGFTIRNGFSDSFGVGGAMAIGPSASLTIVDNEFVDNVGYFGGAIGIRYGEARVLHNRFRGNRCSGSGGALYVDSGLRDGQRITIIGNVFEWNRAQSGAAIASRFFDKDGSGLVHIERNIIRHNVSSFAGAGIRVESGKVFISNNLIHDNRAVYGGGILVTGERTHDRFEIVNNTVANNTGMEFEAILTQGSRAKVANNIFVTAHGDTSLYCRLYENSTASFSRNLVYAPGGATIRDCDVADGGLIATDPLWIGGPRKHAYWLTPESPAIDAGDNQAAKHIREDFTGADRIVNGIVDLGAYEFRGN